MIPLSRLDDLCGQLHLREIGRAEFIEECVELTSRLVGCSRAGLWVFIPAVRGRRLRCLGIYDRALSRMVLAPDVCDAQAGTYFDELDRTGHVLAVDARTHPATSGFYADHLRDTGVRSLMAAAFALNGKLFGAFTCSQVDEPVDWSLRQLAVLNRIGARATLALAGASPRQLDSLLAPL